MTHSSTSENWNQVFQKIPFLKDNSHEIRQWTIRFHKSAIPTSQTNNQSSEEISVVTQSNQNQTIHDQSKNSGNSESTNSKPHIILPSIPVAFVSHINTQICFN